MTKITLEVIKIFKEEKKTFIWIFLLVNLVPIIESVLLYLIYLVIEPINRGKSIEKVIEFIGEDIWISSLIQDYSIHVLFMLALLFLLLKVSAQYIQARAITTQSYNLYMRDVRRVLHAYIYSKYEKVKDITFETMLNNVMQDSGSLPMLIKESITIFSALIILVIYIVISLFISPQLTLAAFLIFLTTFIINKKLFAVMGYVGELKIRHVKRVSKFFLELLGGFKRIKIEGRELDHEKYADSVIQKTQKWKIIKRMTEAKIDITTETISVFSFLVILYVGLYLLKIELTLMMMTFLLFTRIRGSVNIIFKAYGRILIFNKNVSSYFNLLDNFNAVDLDYPDKSMSIKSIQMENISFNYDGKEVLDNINFSAHAGDKILIYGNSGEGKSTFLNILAGLYSPSKGLVFFNNKVLDYKLFLSARKRIMYVSSDIYLFNDSIINNIDRNISNLDLNKCLEKACLSEFIEGLDEGVNTNIGADGSNLSLGQKQRLIASRLFIADSDIIILDEPTSNLNSDLAKKLMANIMKHISPNAILIIVSHHSFDEIEFTHKYKISNKTIKMQT
jgi:ABC-type bacteriocin/lantibiotic exporter with double-glycine peptidase domain